MQIDSGSFFVLLVDDDAHSRCLPPGDYSSSVASCTGETSSTSSALSSSPVSRNGFTALEGEKSMPMDGLSRQSMARGALDLKVCAMSGFSWLTVKSLGVSMTLSATVDCCRFPVSREARPLRDLSPLFVNCIV